MEQDESFFLQEILEQIQAGYWDWNLVSDEKHISPRTLQMLGYAENEIENTSLAWEALLFKEDIPLVLENFKLHIESKGKIPFRNKVRYHHKDGSTVWILYTGRILEWDDEGKPRRIIGTYTDITEQKAAEEALRQSEFSLKKQIALLNVLLDNLTTGVFMVEVPSGKPLIANSVAREILGRGILPDANRENLSEVYKAHKLGETSPYPVEEMPIIRGMSGESSKVYDMVIERPDGKETLLEITGVPVRNDKDEIWASLVSFQDISERKHMEEILSNTQKLESLGVLAGGIAHDFNNLMGGIFGFIEQAHDLSSEDRVKEILDKVTKNIDRSRSLTQQLLTFAKGGSPVMEVAPFFPFIKQAVQFALSGSSVSSYYIIDENLWMANYDKNQIAQVIDNLVINALQAMPSGGNLVIEAHNKEIAKGQHPVLKAGKYVVFIVSDNGTGIPKEIQSRIFDPFFTTKQQGYGLGLSTSHSIITRHGGAIEVFSELGKGTTFTMYLPAVITQPQVEQSYAYSHHRGSGTFLVMDDDEVMREILTAMLKLLGYEVVCTENGQEAVNFMVKCIINKKNVSGMLFDLTVPGGMGGKEAIEKIRAMGIRIPAFVASGYADDPIIINPKKYGFNASIRKPFIKTELIDILEKHMYKEEGNR